MTKRSYSQYCGIARALDIVGERWTLLIIRELMLGPRRFKDLEEGLPGIGTNLLSDRLKKLTEYEVIRKKKLPPPASSTVYELTEIGRELEPVLESLGAWGFRYLGPPDDEDLFSPRWLLLALKTTFRPDRAGDIDKVIEFNFEKEVLYAHFRDGSIETRQGHHPDADLVIKTDSKSFVKLITGSGDRGRESGEIHLKLRGETELFDKLSYWFDTQA